MSNSFSDLKRSRKTDLESLIKQTNEKSGTQSDNGPDERFWKPEVDKAGNGYAVIRFLPAPQGEELPWVRIFNHGFQGPGGWYIENSLTTLGKKDPLSEYNSQLWNNGTDAGKAQARKQKRRLSYISNIYVVSDPANPQNEGKVFLYKYGKKIWDKLNEAMNPEFQDETPVNPFDFWEGANLKLKMRNVEGYRNYDKSEFETSSAVLDDDDAMEGLWKTQNSLQEFVDAKQFKTYEELETRLNKVLGLDGASAKPRTTADDEDDQIALSRPTPQVEAAAPRQVAEPTTTTAAADDDDLSFFERLANED
jgi:hypothetical protein